MGSLFKNSKMKRVNDLHIILIILSKSIIVSGIEIIQSEENYRHFFLQIAAPDGSPYAGNPQSMNYLFTPNF